jgi:hypothetical protein
LPVNFHPFNLPRGKGEHDLEVISDLNDFHISDRLRIANQWRKRIPHLGAGGEGKQQTTEGENPDRLTA